jgi:hypothetical protein
MRVEEPASVPGGLTTRAVDVHARDRDEHEERAHDDRDAPHATVRARYTANRKWTMSPSCTT